MMGWCVIPDFPGFSELCAVPEFAVISNKTRSKSFPPHPLVCDAAAAAAARLLPVFLNECQRAAARMERGAALL